MASANTLVPPVAKVTPVENFTFHVEGAHFAVASFALFATPSPRVVVSALLHHRFIAATRPALS